MLHVGFIGLGQMGSRMAQRLLDAGYTVSGWNRSQDKAESLVQNGMQWAATPRAATEASDIVITMLTDGQAVNNVAEGDDGILAGLSADQIFIDMSTVNPSFTLALADKVAARGGHMLDAPVSGSKLTVEQGKLTIMVGGDMAVLERVRPVLEAIGPTILYIGPNGHAVAVKLAINLSIFGQVLMMAEGVLLAEQYGVSRQVTVDTMLNSAIASPALKYRGPFLAEMPDEAWFNVDMAQKDIGIAQEVAKEVGVALPAADLVNELLDMTRDLGLAAEDFAIIIRALEARSTQTG